MKKYNFIYLSHYPWSNIMSRYINLGITLGNSRYVNNLIMLEPLKWLGDVDLFKSPKLLTQVGRYSMVRKTPMPIYSCVVPVLFRNTIFSKKWFDLWSVYSFKSISRMIPSVNKILFMQGYSEYHLNLIKYFKKMGALTVFDWGNLYEENAGTITDKQNTARLCREIAKIADIVFCISPAVENIAKFYNEKSYLLSDAVWKKMIINNPAPPKLKEQRLNSPVICYFGLINPTKLDCSLVSEIAKMRPKWNFKFIGPRNDPENIGLDFDAPNIEIIEPMDGKTLHLFLRENADLSLIPYSTKDKVAFACSPLKLYESFANGLPIASTKTFDPLAAKNMITFGNTAKELVDAIEHELETDSLEKRSARIKFAEKNTWESRVEQVITIINTQFVDRSKIVSNF